MTFPVPSWDLASTSEVGVGIVFPAVRPARQRKEKENSKWRHLRELSGEQPYPVLLSGTVDSFRSEVRSSFTPLLRQTLPSLAETDKPDPDTV